MRLLYFFTIGVFLTCQFVVTKSYAQTITGFVKDKKGKQPISDVFIFFENSSINTITDEHGYFKIESKNGHHEFLIFSHINYKVKKEVTTKMTDTIFLNPKDFVLDEILVIQKGKNKTRKKRLKRFKEAFLGAGVKEQYLKILNPEVILFKEERGMLIAEADKPIMIHNQFLGYKLHFYLSDFKLSPNDDLRYMGSAYFEPLDGSRKEKIKFKRNRVKIFQKSSRSFFMNLISDKIDPEQYSFGYADLDLDGELKEFKELEFSSLSIESNNDYRYKINLDRVFIIIHKEIKYTPTASINNQISSTISQLREIKKTPKLTHANSCFIAKKKNIVINQYGHILNLLEIEELGYWAESRIGSLLPSDFHLEAN